MFDDMRSKRVCFVAHCILNQNSKIDQCAHYPGVIKEIVQAIMDTGVGIVQMPCPELLYLGLDRRVDKRAVRTVESEDTRVSARMAEGAGKTLCREIANNLIYQIEEYRNNGFEIVAIVGINGSPTCGVETTWASEQEKLGPGIFINALYEGLRRKNIMVPMRGIKAYEPQRALATVMVLLDTLNKDDCSAA